MDRTDAWIYLLEDAGPDEQALALAGPERLRMHDLLVVTRTREVLRVSRLTPLRLVRGVGTKATELKAGEELLWLATAVVA